MGGEMKPRPYKGTHCVHLRNLGPTMVPYGEGWVPLGCDDWKCTLGYDPGVCDCPDGTEEVDDYRRPAYAGRRLRWETEDDGDYAYDSWVEDGR
jgi:hypothetical protein